MKTERTEGRDSLDEKKEPTSIRGIPVWRYIVLQRFCTVISTQPLSVSYETKIIYQNSSTVYDDTIFAQQRQLKHASIFQWKKMIARNNSTFSCCFDFGEVKNLNESFLSFFSFLQFSA